MKIIHCLNYFLPESVAGTEIYVAALVNALLQKNIEALVLVPNFGKASNATYDYGNIRVIQFAEPSARSRDLIRGKLVPVGLINFIKILEEEQPSIVHFHIAGRGSNGFGLHHMQAAKQMGAGIVMTFHIAGYTCTTGTLVFKNKTKCDGIIDVKKCTRCIYTSKKMGSIKSELLYAAAMGARTFNYDTTHWNNTPGTAIGMPFVVEELKKNLSQLASVCDKMVVLSQWYRKVLERNHVPPDKLVHISQGLPAPSTSQTAFSNGTILKIVFIGRIHETKGLHLLIEALKQLPQNNITLDIYGQLSNDDYATRLQGVTANMKNIQWKGLLGPEKILITLSHYHCLCVPSVICEMSPLVIQEAFAAGIPVIASDVYGNAEQIENNVNGWLFNFNDSDDLKNQLQLLMDNPQMIREARAKMQPVKPFSKVADEHEQLYRLVISQRAGVIN